MVSLEEQDKRRLALRAEVAKNKPRVSALTMEQRLQERLQLRRKGIPLEKAVEISQHDVR